MNLKTIVAVSLFFLLGTVGCASTEDDTSGNNTNNFNTNNNTNYNNNQNNNQQTGSCAQSCTGADQICVGPDPDHQTCADKCDAQSCPEPYTCCYGGCVNLHADPNNCGACWKACDEGASCINNMCVDACSNSCGQGEKCCNAACTDVMSDANNCGSCGNICPSETSNACTNGYCTCGPTAECTGGKQCCSNGCRDLQKDVANCGSCGHECAPGETCANGQCQCGSSGVSCNPGEGCCNGSCVDLNSDDNNCGSCGTVCSQIAEGYTCNQGTCNCAGDVCQAGGMPGQDATCCGSSGCVDWGGSLTPGAKNCGSCGNDCGATELCLLGQCQSLGQ